jgi:prolyl oligopeptidase
VRDPYRWLEDGDAPEVRAWTEAQGAHARTVLDGVPGREAVARRLEALFSIGSVAPPVVRRGRYFYEKREGQQQQPRLYLREGCSGPDRVLLDPAELAPDAAAALDWHYPSPDGRLLAYGISEGGTEKSTLRVRDVDAGRDLDLAIPWTRACSLAWLPDASGFYYTRYPEPGSVAAGEEDYHRHVFLHRLGDDWRHDPRIFGADREPEDWPMLELSPGGRWLVVSVARGWTRSDVYLLDRASQAWRTLAEGEELLYAVTPRDDRLYIHTNRGAARFRLLACDPERPELAAWSELIPEGPDVLEGVAVVGATLLAQWLHDAAARLTRHDQSGQTLGEVPLPGLGSLAGITGEWDGEEAFFGYSSYTLPPVVYRLDPLSGEAAPWQRVAGDVDADRYVVERAYCTSRDGTRVSMFLVRLRERRADGDGAAVLYGYGGFSISLTPAFGRGVLMFLDRGGLFAVAQLRGGGEYGEAWHRAGMLGRKQASFDDALAAAEHLLSRGHAAPDRLAIMGGSNGGLLVGAALTQRPELFRAAVCQVPLLDMLRYHRFRIARLWIAEYGSPEDAEAFGWLLAYSPYHRVRDGTAYPAVLLTTGESDSRVDPMHARKMAARLQAASASGRPVLLRVEGRAGHGQGKPLAKVVAEWTDVWTFLLSELGLATRSAG